MKHLLRILPAAVGFIAGTYFGKYAIDHRWFDGVCATLYSLAVLAWIYVRHAEEKARIERDSFHQHLADIYRKDPHG